MKTYQIYTADGKSAGSVDGDEIVIGSVITIRLKGQIVAAVPIGSFAIVALS